jgi:hypothetical protein
MAEPYESGINPRVTLARRMQDGLEDGAPPLPPATGPQGLKFTKAFTPEEKLAQQKQLAALLRARQQ